MPGEIAFIGIQPESMELGTDLTPTCKAAAEEALGHVVARLGARGTAVRARRAA